MKEERASCFVIQPFGKKLLPDTEIIIDNDQVYGALKKLEKIRPDFPIIVDRADRTKVRKEDLHAHVIDCIRNSDFCIADFTGQNPNVIYETGFARGIGREVLVICQDRASVPTDLRGIIAVPYNMNELTYLSHDIEQHFDRVIESIGELRKARHPMVPYFSSRTEALVRSKIRNAKAKIDILQTNLSNVQGSYLTDLRDALKEHPELELRILTLNPQSLFVNFRAEQVGHKRDVAAYRNELQSSLNGVYMHLKDYEERVRIKIYDDLPTQITFFFDSEILASVVSALGRSRYNCAFLLPVTLPGAGTSFVEHFDHLWNQKSMPFEDRPLTCYT